MVNYHIIIGSATFDFENGAGSTDEKVPMFYMILMKDDIEDIEEHLDIIDYSVSLMKGERSGEHSYSVYESNSVISKKYYNVPNYEKYQLDTDEETILEHAKTISELLG